MAVYVAGCKLLLLLLLLVAACGYIPEK